MTISGNFAPSFRPMPAAVPQRTQVAFSGLLERLGGGQKTDKKGHDASNKYNKNEQHRLYMDLNESLHQQGGYSGLRESGISEWEYYANGGCNINYLRDVKGLIDPDLISDEDKNWSNHGGSRW